MTDHLLDDERHWSALADAATPGPWHHDRSTMWACVTTRPCGYGRTVTAAGDGRDIRENAAFIAAARTAIPALCQRLAEARAELAKCGEGIVDLLVQRGNVEAERDEARARCDALATSVNIEVLNETRRERDEARAAVRELCEVLREALRQDSPSPTWGARKRIDAALAKYGSKP